MKIKNLPLLLFLLLQFNFQLDLEAQTKIGMDILGEQGDGCGSAVAFSDDGSRLAVGYFWTNDSTGMVRIFDNVNDQWQQVGSTIFGDDSYNYFGVSVSLSANGNRIVIGAHENSEFAPSAGLVKVYEFVNGDWSQLGNTIFGENTGDEFGYSVSISSDGTRIAASSPSAKHPIIGTPKHGKLRIFELINQSWIPVGNTIFGAPVNDELGWSISLSGDGSRVAAGTRLGHLVKVFDYQNNEWVQAGDDLEGQFQLYGVFGFSISLTKDGQYLAVGAHNNDNDNGFHAGQVYVYKFLTGSWVQHGNEILGSDTYEQLGWSVSISDDGSKVAASALTFNSTDLRHVKTFELLENTWVQLGSTIYSNLTDELFGYRVQLSSAGDYLAIGSTNNQNVAVDAGLVRVFEFSGPNLISDDDCFNFEHTKNNNQFILSGDFSNCDIFILNQNENVVQFLLNTNEKITIDINDLPNGLHFIRVAHQNKPELFIQHIVKQ